ncbi:MAG TPA: PAS domain-containing sensor histidine kinase [Anaerovoracaceae bacterium]|nr:PAS domain-containing sensor histidine kinase [Anaerovoracaceae bacterium]
MIINAATIHTQTNLYLNSSPEIVTDISYGFTELTGYTKDDLVNKDIFEVLITQLRSPKESLEKIKNQNSIECYIFTKSLEPIEVTISLSHGHPQNIYTLAEKPNSRLNDKLIFEEQLFKDNKIGCSIYSVPDLILLKSNQRYLDFMDPPYNILENNIGTSLFQSVPGFIGSNSDELFSTVIKTGKPSYYNEFKYDHYERGATYWDGSVIPIYLDNKIKYIFQTATEITERVVQKINFEKQTEIIKSQYLKLTRQNELLSKQTRLLNLPNEAIFAWDLNGGITYWNKGAEKKYGYSSAEAIGCVSHDLLKMMHQSEIDDIKLTLARDGFWFGEIEHTCKSGRKIIVETSQQVILDEQGKRVVLETNRDITEIIKTRDELNHKEEQLREQKDYLEAILENMSDAIAIFDINGNYILKNAAFQDLYPKTEISKLGDGYVTARFFDTNNKEISLEEMAATKVRNGKRVVEDILMMVRGDEKIYLSISGTPLFDINGKVRLGIICTRDVSSRFEKEIIIKNQQKALLNAEIEKNDALIKAIEVKDEFLALISHELKTPLTVINSAIQTMGVVCANELSDKAREYLNKIERNTNRQLKLVNNILDNTRLNAGRFKIRKKNTDIVLLTRTITEATTNFAEHKGVKLSFSSTLKEKVINFDEEQYEKILLNLLSNAIKFTPKGKSIHVKVSQKTVKGIVKVYIKVKDEGIGIPKDKRDLIFERFGQVDNSLSRQAEGSGIGLSIVKMLIELHSGEIILDSEEGVGSTFTIILPEIKSNEESVEAETTEKPNDSLQNAAIIEFSDVYLI